MLLNDKTYNILKRIVQVILPATIALYSTLASLWSWPHAVEVAATLGAITTFLGIAIGVSTKNFNAQSSDKPDGDLIVAEGEGEKYFGLGINEDAFASIGDKNFVRLNVVRKTPPPE